MSQAIEQMDLFDYITDLEATAAPSDSGCATTSCVESKVSSWIRFIIRFAIAYMWFRCQLPVLFGLLQWVNVYTVTRGFGLAGKTGFYYKKYKCEESHLVPFWNAEWLQYKLQLHFVCLKWGEISVESQGQDIAVCIEPSRAA